MILFTFGFVCGILGAIIFIGWGPLSPDFDGFVEELRERTSKDAERR